jgi:hypothetical protein
MILLGSIIVFMTEKNHVTASGDRLFGLAAEDVCADLGDQCCLSIASQSRANEVSSRDADGYP